MMTPFTLEAWVKGQIQHLEEILHVFFKFQTPRSNGKGDIGNFQQDNSI